MFWCQSYFDLSIQDIMEISEKLKTSERMHFLVVKEDDQVVGFSMFYYLAEVKLGYLEYIFVRNDCRSLGIGSSLYRETLNTLQKNHPEVRGLVLEVQGDQGDLSSRKEFFLNQGAFPVNLAFYPLPRVIQESGLMLMFQPIKEGIKLTYKLMDSMFDDLTTTLFH